MPKLVSAASAVTLMSGTIQAELVSYWNLDETAGVTAADSATAGTDSSATFNLAESFLTWEPGQIDNGASFGSAGSANFSVPMSELDGLTSFSIAGWFRFQSSQVQAYNGVFMTRNVLNNDGSEGGLTNGSFGNYGIAFRQFSGSSDWFVESRGFGAPTSNIQVFPDTWYHVGAVYDFVNNLHIFYVDGVEIGRRALYPAGTPLTGIVSSGEWALGGIKFNNSQGNSFSGSVDDWGVWDEVLAGADFARIASTGAAGIPLTGDPNDSDGDGISDAEEIAGTANPFDGNGNFVGVGNGGASTLPDVFDTDGDGISDGAEITGSTNPFTGGVLGTAPGDPTNPNSNDTDGDTLLDNYEITNELDPRENGTAGESTSGAQDGPNGALGDPDNDGLTNAQERDGVGIFMPTDPQDNDSDNDGVLDGAEVNGTDNTAFSNAATDPNDNDSDNDGLTDGQEITGSQNPFLNNVLDAGAPTMDGDPTNPNSNDSDNDTLLDNAEIAGRLNPNEGSDGENGETDDPDMDTLNNAGEIAAGTDPRNPDTDNDTILDGVEVTNGNSDPTLIDTDSDGLNDNIELDGTANPFDVNGNPVPSGMAGAPTVPNDPDSDDDGFTDNQEVTATPATDPNSASSSPPLTIVAYWSMDEVSGDIAREHANAANGVSDNDAFWDNFPVDASDPVNLTWGAGQIGNAATLGGNADDNGNFFDVGSLAQLNGQQELTISMWIRPNDHTDNGGYDGIFMTRSEGPSSGQNVGFGYQDNQTLIDSRGAFTGSNQIDSANGSAPFDTWIHIALVSSGVTGEASLYINGQPAAGNSSVGTTLGFTFNGQGWQIGIDPGTPNRDFDGSIDDVAMVANALPQSRIQEIYNAGIATEPMSFGDLFGIETPDIPVLPSGNITVSAIAIVGDNAGLTFSSTAGVNYVVQYSPDLSTAFAPTSVTVVGAAGATETTVAVDLTLLDGSSTAPARGFFRISEAAAPTN